MGSEHVLPVTPGTALCNLRLLETPDRVGLTQTLIEALVYQRVTLARPRENGARFYLNTTHTLYQCASAPKTEHCYGRLIGMEKQKNKNFNKEYYCRNIRRCKTCGGCRICFDRKISPGTDESLGTYLLHEAPSQTQDASFNEVVSGEHCAAPFSLSVNSSAFVWTSDESRQHNRFPRSFALMKTPR
ncbi:hypothetical protein F2P81_002750 [Scophthalmus maximus]|uniref:Uncharacterized protein n=1 Tax=Scophthalmus maximus TaxID=52904 RepID=A0A6A4TU57_SCOMX|nr:hypothetical protein F2P81_002750 [Scophthalmus maximus]